MPLELPSSHPSLERVDIDLAPVEVAARLRHLPGFVFFDTALDPLSASVPAGALDAPLPLSIVAALPTQVLTGRSENDWEALRKAVAVRQVRNVASRGIPQGFAAGWVDYDGTFCFGFYDNLLACRQGVGGGWTSVGRLHRALQAQREPGKHAARRSPLVRFASAMRREEFTGMVRRARDYIAAGDIYQVNLSHRFTAPWPRCEEGGAEAFALYRALRRCSPAPHAAFLQLDGRAVLSSSPELFLKISGRAIRTRPIKGTRPRRTDPLADQRSAQELIASPKENAELVMITDLERNDLGQVCEFGSVGVGELLKLERFEQVFHLVSTVDGRLRPGVDAVTALRACFPGGSITGAPKKRAMEIIAELERSPRGLYTGAIGYFGFNGESQFNIAIRTVVIENGEAHFGVGAGIVADSDPEMEWQETLDKAAGILLAGRRATAEYSQSPLPR